MTIQEDIIHGEDAEIGHKEVCEEIKQLINNGDNTSDAYKDNNQNS